VCMYVTPQSPRPKLRHMDGNFPYFVLFTGCNMSDELFESFEQLLALSERRGIPFDRCLCSYKRLLWCGLPSGTCFN